MTWNDVATPAGWVTVTTGISSHIFLSTAPLTFTLSASTATTYEVRDYWGAIVRSGAVSGLSLTLTALPLGWYKLYLRRVTVDANYGTLIGAQIFSIIGADSRFPAPVAAGTVVSSDPGGKGVDHGTRGVAMLGPIRSQINTAGTPTLAPQNIAGAQSDQVYIDQYYVNHSPDAARPRPCFLQFPNGATSGAQLTGVTTTVAALYPSIQYFEGWINEPALTSAAADETAMEAFHAAVKAGHASAKVLGPNPVSMNGSMLTKIGDFLAAGGGNWVDALSFHAYNCANGDIVLGRKVMDALVAVLTTHGVQGKERWQTEYGTFAASFGVLDFGTQSRWAMMHRFIMEQYGIPKERDCWFYDTSHGFWDYSSFWRTSDGSIMPMILMMRTYSQEVHGKTWTSALDFGVVENNIYIGSRFTASNGTQTLAFLGGGRTDGSVILDTTAATLVMVSPFGVTSTLTANAGAVTVPVGMEPVYVRVPAGVTATVRIMGYGKNLTTWGADVTVGGTATDRLRVVNAVMENWYYQGSAPTEFRSDATLPETITVSFNVRQTFDTVHIHCPGPWQSSSTLLDYDLHYLNTAGAWVLIGTVVEPANVVEARSPAAAGRCIVESYHSGRSIFVHEFSRVTGTAIRLTVRDTTYGGVPNAAASAAGGQGGPHKVCIREVAVYSRDSQNRRLFGIPI